MKICFVTKYPPIQGGVSMRCYWLARGLAELGHDVAVVTNATEVEHAYRMFLDGDDAAWLEPTFDGGRVRLFTPDADSGELHHIPHSSAYVSRLAGLATDVIKSHNSEVIFSYYLEPYGVAAHLASAWTGVPYVVRHAGSDLGRLMKNAGLRTTFREVFVRADVVQTGAECEPFIAMGVDPNRIWQSRAFPLPPIFHGPIQPLDLNDLVGTAQRQAAGWTTHIPASSVDPSLPTVGVYGKLGAVKGSFDLLRALGALRREGVRFNLVAISQGKATQRFIELIKLNDLADCAWVLPFVPHWRIPSFVRACACACCLERDFPISFHGPTLPREVLATGTCLVVSREVFEKQQFRDTAENGGDLIIVDDPRQTDVLAAALRRPLVDRAWALDVGRRGRAVLAERESPEAWMAFIQQFAARLALTAGRSIGRPQGTPADAADHLVPLTRACLAESWPEIAARATDAPLWAAADRIDRAALLLESAARVNGDTAPHIGEVVRYERAHIALFEWAKRARAASGDVRANRAEIKEALTQGDYDFLWACAPSLAAGTRIEFFDYDITAVADLLTNPTATLVNQSTPLLLKAEPNYFGQEFVVGVDVAYALGSVDGVRTVRDVFLYGVQMNHWPAGDDAEQGFVALIRRLWLRGLIELSPPQRADAPRNEQSEITARA